MHHFWMTVKSVLGGWRFEMFFSTFEGFYSSKPFIFEESGQKTPGSMKENNTSSYVSYTSIVSQTRGKTRRMPFRLGRTFFPAKAVACPRNMCICFKNRVIEVRHGKHFMKKQFVIVGFFSAAEWFTPLKNFVFFYYHTCGKFLNIKDFWP